MIDWLIVILANIMLVLAVIRICTGCVRGEPSRVVGGLVCATVPLMVATVGLDSLQQWVDSALRGFSWPDTRPSSGHDEPPVEWGTLLRYLGYVVAAILAGLTAAEALRRHSLRRAGRRKELEAREAEAARWAALHADHDAVRDQYGAWRMDALAFLDRPAFDDATVPQTAAFLQAMFEADDTRRGEDLPAYRAAVGRLLVTWKAADAHARRVGISAFSSRSRVAINQARKLLRRAQDSAGGLHEQRLAMTKARKLLAGILDLPQEAVAALETSHRLSLTKGTRPSSG
ncbi:hypothetical protein ACFCY8_10510 [Streptomyces noursei]|uniref:hypothetical protein n=1 Tax=Streptomyces noursei TaxID=1971 RepID=UPI0035E197C5